MFHHQINFLIRSQVETFKRNVQETTTLNLSLAALFILMTEFMLMNCKIIIIIEYAHLQVFQDIYLIYFEVGVREGLGIHYLEDERKYIGKFF